MPQYCVRYVIIFPHFSVHLSTHIDAADPEDNIRASVNTCLKKTNLSVESLSTPDAITTVLGKRLRA